MLKSLLGVLLMICSSMCFAQPDCAGSDGAITICNYADPATQNINLFTLLGDSPTPGGTWSDSSQTGALNPQTGVLDVWDLIMSGIYVFTYTINSGGCNDTSTVTLTLGGYSGISNADNSACNNDNSVNLFQFFVGDGPNPHQNGTWTYTGPTTPNLLTGSIFNAVVGGVGTHNFTYTMPAVGTCPAVSSSISVTVYRTPLSGTRLDMLFCNTEDFSDFTNVNLFDHLAGEDPNGQWTENLTDELSSPFDSIIDVQNIFNTYGMGIYSFSYTVYPPHPVCPPRTTVVRLFIEQYLDFTGATVTINSDICESEIPTAAYTAVITPGIQPIPNGQYNITYQIAGPMNTTFTQTTPYGSGGFSFGINPAFFPSVGDYTFTVLNIKKNSDLGACNNTFDLADVVHVYPLPLIDDATVDISPMCQSVDGQVQISGNTNLATGTYQISYDLSGANTATNQTATINTVNGIGTLTIPGALLPNSGNTTIIMFSTLNLTTGCTNAANLVRNFMVNGNTITNLTFSATDSCANSAVTVNVSGLGPMTDVIITYTLSGANTATDQTITAPVTSGTVSFEIPIGLTTNSGITTFTITQITDGVTLCSTTVNSGGIPFTIHPSPSAPVASDAVFCAGDSPTVADLVPGGSQFLWYESGAAILPLHPSTPLVSGVYFVAEESSGTTCESDRTEIAVTVITLDQLVLIPGGQDFCGADDPTLQDLSDNILADNFIIWYDAEVNGNQLPNSTLLVEDMTYYGANSFPGSSCNSPLLAIKVSLDECPEPDYGLFIPDGFSPNGDSVNDVFRIPDVHHLFPDYVLEIYNRYGNLVFKGNASNPAWDGRNSQSDNLIDGIAANGVYFYVLYYNKNNAPPRQGQLYLNR